MMNCPCPSQLLANRISANNGHGTARYCRRVVTNRRKDRCQPHALQLLVVILMSGMMSLQAHAFDLLQVYRTARENDPVFEAARYTLEAAREKIPQARASFLPTVNLNGNYNRTSADTTYTNAPVVTRNVNSWAWSLQLTQPLLRMQSIYAYSESEALVEMAVAQYSQAEQDLILRVSQAYFDVLVAQETVTAVEAQVQAMNEQLAAATHGFKAGTSTVTDVHEAKSKAELARAQQVAALYDLDNKRAELGKLVGEAPDQLAALQPAAVSPSPDPAEPQAWIVQARENNPTVRLQKATLDAAEANVKKLRAEHLPTLDLTASVGDNYASGSLTNPSDFSSRSRSQMAGVQLSVPIYSGGATSSRVHEAAANQYKARAQLEEARRKAGADARQAFAGIMSGVSQIAALQSAVESGGSSVNGNKAGYQLGLRINSDVLAAEQQLYLSIRDLVKARYDTLFQGLKLKAAAGILNEADLLTINAMLRH